MYEQVDEKIDVLAVFGKGFKDIKPLKFKWGGKEYPITKIGYKHKVTEGRKIIHVFSATDGTNFFELRFDSSDLGWVMGRIWDGNAT